MERNLEFIRNSPLPMPLRYVVVAFFMPIWKWFYYSPNTWKELKLSRMKPEDIPTEMKREESATMATLTLSPFKKDRASARVVNRLEFFTRVVGPFLLSRFVLLPAPLLLLPGIGGTAFQNALINLVAADLITNIHGFITIVTNHAGDDVYAFDDAVMPQTDSFYVRQVVGSVNYDLGTDSVDFAHGWLNYQIEHHVWPSLSMLQYQRGAPKLEAICNKYGVPYVKENVFQRLRKTVDIMVGKTDMKVFPTHLEPEKDKAIKEVQWTTTHGDIAA